MIYDVSELLLNNPLAEGDIKIKIDKIVNKLLDDQSKNSVIAYLLGGGFGRGEGSVIKNGDIFETTNDYDIFAICTDSIVVEEIQLLEKRIEKELDLQFFGIDIIKISEFEESIDKQIISQSYFDVFAGNKILWVNDSYLQYRIAERLSEYSQISREIKRESAYDVLKTRMWCIVALADYCNNELYDKEYVKNYKFFYFQQVKVATAIIDAVLISDGLYTTPCFYKKLEIFSDSVFSKEYDTQLIVRLVKEKILNINSLKFDKEDEQVLWNLYCECIRYIINADKKIYKHYKNREYIKQIYYKYVKRKKHSVWRFKDYEYIYNHNEKKLKNLQLRMRRIYK